MTITREIDGKVREIELTPSEIYGAYVIQEFEFYKDDIRDVICGMSDEDVQECFGVSMSEFEELLDDMTYEMRRMINKYDVSREYARDEAIRSEIERNMSGQ